MSSEWVYDRKANGKLLLTSEYFVLDGAKSIALPTQLGQKLRAKKAKENHWTAYDVNNHVWFDAGENAFITNSPIQTKFQEVFEAIREQKEIHETYKFVSFLEFDRNWGLGSSSTFVALISDFYKVNPYYINRMVFKGSGYDIACAFSSTPILYQIIDDPNQPNSKSIVIPQTIQDNSFFIYLNKKENSKDAIQRFQSLDIDKSTIIEELNIINDKLCLSSDSKEWINLLNYHNELISENIKIPQLKDNLLKGFPYFVKYLGAWGGDFALVITSDDFEEVKSTFSRYNIHDFFTYKELIL